jgi:uncharacterized protein (TIGR00299 family) protein
MVRVLHVDGAAGVAGDMVLGALIDLGVSVDALREGLAGLELEGWELDAEPVTVRGLAAVRAHVRVQGREELPPDASGDQAPAGHHHGHGRTWPQVRRLLEGARLPGRARERALAVFGALFEAEAAVHGRPVDEVHLHEAGAVDALVDVVGACLGLELLAVDRVTCAPPLLGSGTLRCAHGVLPIPPPAVLKLLEGRPTRGGGPPVELTTPTGAALLRALAEDWTGLAPQALLGSGYGAGARELDDRANVVRLTLGESDAGGPDGTLVIEADLDDASPELLAEAAERLRAEGALDVAQAPVVMKKGRAGTRLSVLCREDERERLVDALFAHAPTIGCRWHRVERAECSREIVDVETRFGPIPVKVASWKGRIVNRKPEHEACARAAARHGVALRSVLEAVSCALPPTEEQR